MPDPALVAVVDDDPTARMLAVRILESAGFAIDEFDSGGAFLSAVQSRTPDAILLDFQLGDMDAHDVIMRMLNLAIVVPIVILTSTPDAPRVVEVLTTGLVSEVLAKPRDVLHVVDAINAAIEAAR